MKPTSPHAPRGIAPGLSLTLSGALLLVCTPARGAQSQSPQAELLSGFGNRGPVVGLEAVPGEDEGVEPMDLTELDLEELLELDVSVVSRQEQSLASAPAAVYVITGEEIRRAGHTSIQEALRMVPGIFVSRWDDTEWDVTSRGFGPGLAQLNLAYLNQMLVMLDGVVVYSPLLAGMRWSLQDLDLEDVERIEVIRGPSGILWGANAFHGLINVVTKRAAETQGAKLSGRISNEGGFANLRYGGGSDQGWSYRAWLRSSRSDGLAPQPGAIDPAEPNAARFGEFGIHSAGATFDWLGSDQSSARLWTRFYDYAENYPGFSFGPPSLEENTAHGGQLGLSYSDPSSGSTWSAFYVKDRQDYREIETAIDVDYVSLEYRQLIELSSNQTLQAGLGYDLIHSDVDYFAGFAADSTQQNNFRAFLSDEFRFPEQNLSLSVGILALYTTFTGFDVQPSLKASYSPPQVGNLWASISRAVRTPSIEEEVVFGGLQENENVLAHEIGWRRHLVKDLSVDATLYYNNYEDVRFDEFDLGTGETVLTNLGDGYSRGGELALDYVVRPGWTLRGAYSYHSSSHGPSTPGGDLSGLDGQYPQHIYNLRSYMDLGRGFELDLATYVTNRFRPDLGSDTWRSDARLGWNPKPGFKLSLGVQSFHDPRYFEYPVSQLRQVYYLLLTWTP